VSHLLSTLNKALGTFEDHLSSVQRSYCDAQTGLAKALQARYTQQKQQQQQQRGQTGFTAAGVAGATDDSGNGNSGSSSSDDYACFEYFNAKAVQDVCARQLLEHIQRYEVYWRVTLEGGSHARMCC
jgi:hypothetical protein